MTKYILGIDTSAYTTSIAIIDTDGCIVCDLRRVLSVPMGSKGLRQQEAVFIHMKNFAEMFDEIDIDLKKLYLVCVSCKPRNIESSYMPVFTVGVNYGKTIAKALGIQYIEYSHQENHIGAALIDNYKVISDKLLVVHISGGTTEFLSVHKSTKGYSPKIIGGTKDITFGQLIDRIGISMGFSFPCGAHMEKSINDKNPIDLSIKLPIVKSDNFVNLSGMENFFKNLYIRNDKDVSSIIQKLFEYIGICIVSIVHSLKDNYIFDTIIITGGVVANTLIRNYICEKLENNYKIILPTIKYSSDNALGNCYLPIIDEWYKNKGMDI